MLLSYCRSLRIRKGVGVACESFKVVGGVQRTGEDAAADSLELVFTSLPNVRNLDLDGGRLVTAFLKRAADGGSPIMPRRERLTLRGVVAGQPDPCLPSVLCGLGSFPRLEKLSFNVRVSDGELDEVQPGIVFTLGALRELALSHSESSPGAVD